MNKRIIVQDDPLALNLPESLDTNFVYELSWDDDEEAWSVNPFPIKTYEEAKPF